MGTGDPLMLEYRVTAVERLCERFDASIDANKDAAALLRQEVALVRQEIKGMRAQMAAEAAASEDREKARDERVKRLTIAWFSIAGSLVVGAVTLALTVAGAN